jgi:glycosyltransferase 2 family protein
MKRIVSIIVSLLILTFLYWKIGPENRAQLVSIFRNCDPLWMTLSLGMVVPLTLFTAWRLQQLMPSRGQLGFGEANRLILVASVLNMVLPSKGGDIAKAWFMKDRSNLSGSLALSLVVFEKSCDMLSLLLWCVFGLFLYPKTDVVFFIMTMAVAAMFNFGLLLLGSVKFAQFFFGLGQRFAPGKMKEKFARFGASWAEMHDYFWSSKKRLITVTTTSVFIWFLHLLQIWLFILALKASVPFVINLALSPLAILAGLLPIPTFGGAGTRDGALVALYAPYFAAPTALALGLLCTARYILPALGGLPFAGHYLAAAKSMKKSDLTGTEAARP